MQAERWYQNIAQPSKKRTMMENYLESVTEMSSEEIQSLLDSVEL